MDFLRPASWQEALAAKAEHPDAVPLAGGTDLMADLNFDRRRPERLLDLSRIPELRTWHTDTGTVRLGACVPYAAIIDHLGDPLPALVLAARTVGSQQIRNRGSVGGNLGTASPAGVTPPALLAAGARVEAASARGSRLIPVEEFCTGPHRNTLAHDELIRAIHIDAARGPQQFAKAGQRNAMVHAVCTVALALRPDEQAVRTGIGSAAPTPVRAREAEAFLAAELADGRYWDTGRALPPALAARFAELAADACRPVDDVRGSAAYRRHAVRVLARRTLTWSWDAYRHRPAEATEGGRACA
ncbi:FAD binding domain-containing protein [Streptomyces sp. 6N223]|uniref:FAD binding domain-containing protein n=1 Tax=Streptomyces sp. 6N223 TaxID=3457412 RepID=UPI003FD4A79E